MSEEIIKEPCPHMWQRNPIGKYFYCAICDKRRGELFVYDISVKRAPDDPAIDAVQYVATMRIWKRP